MDNLKQDQLDKASTVAELFLEWAELNWGIKQIYEERNKKSVENGGESAPWRIVRCTFKKKMEDLIKDMIVSEKCNPKDNPPENQEFEFVDERLSNGMFFESIDLNEEIKEVVPEIIGKIPAEVARRYCVFPVKLNPKGNLVIALDRSGDFADSVMTCDALRYITKNSDIEFVVAHKEQLCYWINKCYELRTQAERDMFINSINDPSLTNNRIKETETEFNDPEG